jgi:cellulose synthase/poly-beta-1,6-N-acetylglucosamine synthase-like glycosyltransferase
VVAPGALLRVAYAFQNPRVAAVTPGIHVKKPGTLLQHLQKTEYRLGIFMRNAFAGLGSIFITPGPFSIFRTAKVRELGGWRHAHSTEDLEMGLRMQEHGLVILNDPQASVYTSSPRTLKALIRQRVRWTYGFLRNAIDYKHMVGNPRYGNLGLFVLPTAIISIATALFFFGLMIWEAIRLIVNTAERIAIAGFPSIPSGIDLFYVNTSISWLFVYFAIGLILVLISIGSYLSTGSRRLPVGTPLFLVLYGFIVPLWLATAVTRAVFKTGVRWR